MRKFVSLLAFLAVFVACNSAIIRCVENNGVCPTMSNPCIVPVELIQEDTSTCGCDYDCKPNFKCCENPCYSNRMCLRAQSSDALETNENGTPLKPVDDNIKKIFKQVQDSISSDKDIKQPVIYQNNAASGHAGNVETPEIKVNVVYNIIKKTYIHNMNVFKGGDKTVQDVGEINNVSQTESNSGIIIMHAKTQEDQGCLDDEDCKEGSGFHPSPSSKTPERSYHIVTDDEDLYHSGSGDNMINVLEEPQTDVPKLTTIRGKLVTADGNYVVFFDEKDKQEGKDGEISYDFDMIDI